jgi:hypothetical protein
MDLEFHVPISPTEGFFNRLRYLFRSWQIYGDRGLSYRFVVTVGADQEPEDLLDRVPWGRGEPIAWRWFPRDLFRRHSWWGTINDRFRSDIVADYFVTLDADMLFAGPIAQAIELLPEDGGIAGVPAYETPFRDLRPGETSAGRWQHLFAAAGLRSPAFTFVHSAAGGLSPAYFNNAFLIMPRDIAHRLGTQIFDEMDNCDRILGHMPFRDQLALTLAIYRLGFKTAGLPLRFNHFIGEPAPSELREEWREARLLHYTNNNIFHSERNADSRASIAEWLRETDANGLDGIRSRFYETLKCVDEAL